MSAKNRLFAAYLGLAFLVVLSPVACRDLWGQGASSVRKPLAGHTAQFFLEQGEKQFEQKHFAVAVLYAFGSFAQRPASGRCVPGSRGGFGPDGTSPEGHTGL